TSSSGEAENDAFVFVVDDGEGGWVDLTTFEIEIDVANKINVTSFDYNVNVYPNPTNDIVNLVFADQGVQSFDVEITDLLGRKLISKTVNSNQLAQDMSSYSAGTYFFKISLENSSKVFKVQVQK
ncbi:T9SS type A sorting domain-containing protein, partial [Saprospiraceae bacterium]|nr:T9SS type A sorting domain-containing protein [Saprospiraceae bacterium]